MKTLYKILNIFFVILGMICFVLIIAFGISFFSGKTILPDGLTTAPQNTTESTDTSNATVPADKHPLLSDSQEKILETFGVDPSTLPASLTPAQQQCFVEKLGAPRVAEIVAGALPTPVEFFSAKDCLNK